jgi:hypothetical protein
VTVFALYDNFSGLKPAFKPALSTAVKTGWLAAG